MHMHKHCRSVWQLQLIPFCLKHEADNTAHTAANEQRKLLEVNIKNFETKQ